MSFHVNLSFCPVCPCNPVLLSHYFPCQIDDVRSLDDPSATAQPNRRGSFALGVDFITKRNKSLSSVRIFSLLFSILSQGADKESLFNNHELLYLVILSFILVTFLYDSVVIL